MSERITQDTKSTVRRRLIFEEDQQHHEVSQPSDVADFSDNVQLVDLATLNEEQKRAQMLRWNFDFVNEQPLNGDWQWEKELPPNPIQQQELIKNLELQKEDQSNDRNV